MNQVIQESDFVCTKGLVVQDPGEMAFLLLDNCGLNLIEQESAGVEISMVTLYCTYRNGV